MKERGIIFSGPMVRAILEDRKTQTRRVVKLPRWAAACNEDNEFEMDGEPQWPHAIAKNTGCLAPIDCPYGKPGDKLWLRETWGVATRPCPREGWVDGIEYRADEAYLQDDVGLLPLYPAKAPDDWYADHDRPGWRSPIHMPRWASRITLEITDVRVERLNSITACDAVNEGFHPAERLPCGGHSRDPRDDFCELWNQINGPGSWEQTPFVWVVEFRREAM